MHVLLTDFLKNAIALPIKLLRAHTQVVWTPVLLVSFALPGLTSCSKNDTSATEAPDRVSASSTVSQNTASAQASTAQLNPTNVPNSLTLYTSIPKAELAPLLDIYQKQANLVVRVINDEPMSILARLKAEGSNSPADVVLTEDIGVFHQAVEAGLLQPFSADKAVAAIPERYRDPDGNWLPLSYYARTVVYDSRQLNKFDIASYASFIKPKWFQKLCLSQASYIPNQSLTINLINNIGSSKTKQVITGWMANLAIPPVIDDTAVLEAIENAECQVGFVNSHHYLNYLQDHPNTPLKLGWANQGYGGVHTNVTALAIPKTTKNPQAALNFIEWIASKEQQTLYASYSNTFPIDKSATASVRLKALGDFEVSPIPISLYADRQNMAIDLMKDAGY